MHIPAGGWLAINSKGAKVKDWKPLFDKLFFNEATTELLHNTLVWGSGSARVDYSSANGVSLHVEAFFRLYK